MRVKNSKVGKTVIVIAGQMPPPIGGQNLHIKQVYELLGECAEFEVIHWKFQFATNSKSFGRVSLGKVKEVVAVIARMIKIRLNSPIDAVLYPVGGPHAVPLIRDIIVLPVALLCASNVYLHFHAAGLKRYLKRCNMILRRCVRLVYSRASAGVVMSEFGKEDSIASGLERTFVLANAVDDVSGAFLVREKRSEVRILSVGHLCREKGTPELINAFGEIARVHPSIHLDLVGEPAREFSQEEIDSLCKENPGRERIHQHGLKQGSELHKYYQNADFFVFSSVAPYESFGLVLVEAMMWSLPVVVSNWRANVEVAGGAEMGGVEYEVKDHEQALKQALLEMIVSRDQWLEMGKKNRLRFEKKFTIGHLKKGLNGLFMNGIKF